MATKPDKPKKSASEAQATKNKGEALSSSAHNIWLAGLGALAQAQANAQAEGSKAFEALVRQGLDMQARTQAMAKQQWAETTQQISALTAQVASNPWDRLSDIFQARVARALDHMGMPGAKEFAELEQRVAALEQTVAKLSASKATAAPNAKSRTTSSNAKKH